MPKRKPLDKKMLYRAFDLNREAIDQEKRTVELAFSSETDKVERWFGIEILDHGAKSVRLGRLQNKAPLLLGHNPNDHIGVVESVSIDSDRVARAVVRFGKGKHASEIFDDVVDGIRTKVSVGYWTYVREETDEGTEHKPVYRVKDWEPYEISFVSLAADDDVGVGRDVDELEINPENEERQMPKETTPDAPQDFDAKAERSAIRAAEMKRQKEIRDLGKRRNMETDADKFIAEDKSVDEFRVYVLDKMDSGDDEPAAPRRHASVDLNGRENEEYSVVRAMNAASTGGWDNAGFEREISNEIAKQLGRSTEGIFIPSNLRHTPEMMARALEMGQRAPLQAGVDASGGYTVQTNVMTLIDMLRNRMVVRRMGAQVLSGLKGDLSFPRQSAGSTFTWTAENPGTDVNDSDAVFDQVGMSPKSGQSSTAYSRQTLAQSSMDIEMFVRNDLTQAGAIGLDYASINGTGVAPQPTGVRNVTGIGSVAGGDNGLAPTWANIVALETAVAIDNADFGALGYLFNATTRGKLKTTEKAASTAKYIWEDGSENGFGSVNGYRAGVTNQLPSNLTKGTGTDLSAGVFGNWADLLIGEWGAIEILLDPYSLKKQGLVEVTSFLLADIAVRHPESFSSIEDLITTP